MFSGFFQSHSYSLLVSASSILLCSCLCWVMAYRLSRRYSGDAS
ncbi:MAG: hypothetical protein AAGF66_10275 [Cyanobacteria bacterium P01_H01_bin.119]